MEDLEERQDIQGCYFCGDKDGEIEIHNVIPDTITNIEDITGESIDICSSCHTKLHQLLDPPFSYLVGSVDKCSNCNRVIGSKWSFCPWCSDKIENKKDIDQDNLEDKLNTNRLNNNSDITKTELKNQETRLELIIDIIDDLEGQYEESLVPFESIVDKTKGDIDEETLKQDLAFLKKTGNLIEPLENRFRVIFY